MCRDVFLRFLKIFHVVSASQGKVTRFLKVSGVFFSTACVVLKNGTSHGTSHGETAHVFVRFFRSFKVRKHIALRKGFSGPAERREAYIQGGIHTWPMVVFWHLQKCFVCVLCR